MFVEIVVEELAVGSSRKETSIVRLDCRTEQFVELYSDISDVIVPSELVPIEY